MLSKPKFARSRISETNVDELIRTRGLFVKLMTAYADVATMTDLIVALAFWVSISSIENRMLLTFTRSISSWPSQMLMPCSIPES